MTFLPPLPSSAFRLWQARKWVQYDKEAEFCLWDEDAARTDVRMSRLNPTDVPMQVRKDVCGCVIAGGGVGGVCVPMQVRKDPFAGV